MSAPRLHSRVAFTDHAVLRYRERVRPGLAIAAARAELSRLLQHAKVLPGPPLWLVGAAQSGLQLVIGDITFPLKRDASDPDLLWAITCLVRGGISSEARNRRNARRRRRRERHENPRGRAAPQLVVDVGLAATEHRRRHPCRVGPRVT